MSETKQVIVVRKDLNMRRGKMVAQGSHASLGAVLKIQEYTRNKVPCSAGWLEPYHEWLESSFKKICVGVDSGEELLEINRLAQEAGLPVKLITDAGHTEFHGVPTLTCLAIGPADSADIDRITGHLKLL